MTEKLLLHGGAIQQAGAVRQKGEQRRTASDFMQMEQDRGISISATSMSFDFGPSKINVLDTPGHQDFSEDTYRALAAADNALMLVDAAKGLEPQTRKLFEVCRMRGLPIFSFCNKLDRPALAPMEIMDQIEAEFGLETHPVVWPIGDGDRFKGLLDRVENKVLLYEKSEKRGQRATVLEIDFSDREAVKAAINDDELFDKLEEDQEILEELLPPLDKARVLSGDQSPLFFGSAIADFGVDKFLDYFVDFGSIPAARNALVEEEGAVKKKKAADDIEEEETPGVTVAADYPEFSGFIFKMQANLDPQHRDRLAYVRVVSGKYEKGMKVKHSRSKSSKTYNLAAAQALFGQTREIIETAYPGDIIGINNPGLFAIGDTLYTGPKKIQFPGIPSFSPEKFAYITNPNPSSYKSFSKGLSQLLDEGAIQMLRQRGDDGGGPMILAAVGQLQFEVVTARLKDEYKVDATLEPIAYSLARWAEGGWDEVDKCDADGKLFGTMIVEDRWKRPVLLFRNDWKARDTEAEEKSLELKPFSLPPMNV
ncbi:hypothetical protein TrVE_jg5394 [Triparma verrucosa]|uniref:Tr-type G domain-containing protein n=2 Tax=Triparma TaxID=722752 RepID=A0A9W7AWZ3_9STRA|nr:hypothetical protein TrST_g10326 [Triparma strigata]GMH81886.1 hypothetical protein TrVE_jg5394 [Triparma verrucosa]